MDTRGEASQGQTDAHKGAGAGAVSVFERASIESEEGRASTSSREEIAAKLPARVQEYRAKGPGCPFLHGSTFGKKLLFLGGTCCVHEAFMACYFADTVTMVVEQGLGDGSEEVVRDMQTLIPSWCAGLGLPAPNMTLMMGSATNLGVDAAATPASGPPAAFSQQASPMRIDPPSDIALQSAEQAKAGEQLGSGPGKGPGLSLDASSVDIAIGCDVLRRRTLEDANKILGNVYTLLVPGGEFSSSEILSDRRLGSCAKSEVLIADGLASTIYVGDFRRIAQQNGFNEPRLLSIQPYVPDDLEAQVALGNVKLFRAALRMFKLPCLEPSCEDYGQVAIYRGSIPECEHEYQLDVHHVFVANQPKLVCGNTATMLGDGWLAPHFHIQGDRSVHYGLFSGSSLLDVSEAKDKCCG